MFFPVLKFFVLIVCARGEHLFLVLNLGASALALVSESLNSSCYIQSSFFQQVFLRREFRWFEKRRSVQTRTSKIRRTML